MDTHEQIRPKTVPAMISGVARSQPDRTALLVPSGDAGFETVSYGVLLDRITSGQHLLAHRNVAPGDRVAILMDDRALWGQCFLGVLWNGRVAVPLDPQLRSGELESILRRSSARAIVVDGKHRPIVEDLRSSLPELMDVLSSDDMLSQQPDESLRQDTLVPQAEGNELASLIFTSGTTGQPKGVMLTHWNLASDIHAIHDIGLCGPDDRYLSVLPIHHAFECTAGFLNPLAGGASVAFARGLSSADIVNGLRQSRATILLAVPLLFEKVTLAIQRRLRDLPWVRRTAADAMLLTSKAACRRRYTAVARVLFKSLREQAALDSLRLVVSGGAALAPWVAEFFDAIGVPILQGYGLTETSPVLTVNRPGEYKYNSVGPPLPAVEMKIDNADENDVGELCARGSMIMAGYFEDDKATAAVLDSDGWFHTGDLGWKSDDGHFHISGRAKNLIVTSAGKNIYPEEIEAALNGSPMILESLVYGVIRDGKTGESPAAMVVPDFDHLRVVSPEIVDDDRALKELMTSEVKRICDCLAAYKRVGDVTVVRDELEKTSTRKIKRPSAVTKYGAGVWKTLEGSGV